MQCYTELTPPTAVTHAVSLPFLSSKATNLVVAKTSLLQIFDVKSVQTRTEDDAPSDSKLSLVAEYTLAGTVTALAPIQLPPDATKTGGAVALLCSFKDAKISLIEWDPEQHKISTISIHYYEGENVTLQPFGPSLGECESILTVDPGSRCAALKFGARGLAILPFRQHGDDLVEDEMDGVAPQNPSALKRSGTGLNDAGEDETRQTPYKASFVLSLTALDPALTHPVHLAFLHEYREPTFGILSASMQPSTALLEERKDVLIYNVFTLDLEQRASTNLVAVQKLPSDLWKVVPLPLPVGGALLVGTNEFVHVDQGGKTTAVAVNVFAKFGSDMSMADQSNMDLKLEGCAVETLDETFGTLLVTLRDGSMAILSFMLQGRNVGGMSVMRVASEQGGTVLEAAPSCIATLHANKLFVGSEDGDSMLIKWYKSTPMLSKKRSHAQMLDEDAVEEDEEEEEEEDEDDLYAPTNEVTKRSSTSNQQGAEVPSSYNFHLCDTLPSMAPLNNVCFGRSSSTPSDKLEFLAGTGRGRASRLAFLSREIPAEKTTQLPLSGAKGAWNVCATPKGSSSTGPETNEVNYDNMLFLYDGESTKPYDITFPLQEGSEVAEPTYTERTNTEFEQDGETISVFTLGNGSRIVQCRRNEIRTYEAGENLALSQIIPMLDEETDAELSIVHVHACDPYVLVIREGSSLLVLQVDKSGDVEPLDLPEYSPVKTSKWLSGCLYSSSLTKGQHAAFLLGEEGGLKAISLPDFQEIYSVPNLPLLPPVFGGDASSQRRGGVSRETLSELLIAPLGANGFDQTYLVLRSATDELTLYEPFHSSTNFATNDAPWTAGLQFRKVPTSHIPNYSAMGASEVREQPLRSTRMGDRAVIVVPGAIPTFIVRERASTPKILGLRPPIAKQVRSLVPVHHLRCPNGFHLIDEDGDLTECRIPEDANMTIGWCVRKFKVGASPEGEEVRFLAFHEERGMYAVATCRNVDFQLPEGESGKHQHDREEGRDEDPSPLPQVPQYTIHLLSASKLTPIHTFLMPPLDTITAFKILSMEISEHTHEQAPRIVVGSAALRGEDMPAKGAVTVLEVLDVVPHPDYPESSGCRLHVSAREETRGAVTTVEGFPGGLVGTTQGQKLMIRGLREDGSCLPVAFLDGQCVGSTLRTLGSTGLWLAGDAWKGVWLGGWTEDPYKLTVLGKSRTLMQVSHAALLPFDGHLNLIVADAASNLQVLQYDPENPKSLSGTRLLHRSTFHTAHAPTSLTLLPSFLAPPSDPQQQPALTNGNGASNSAPDAPAPPAKLSHLLLTTATGALALLTPLDEASYRRLAALQTHLLSILDQPAGLNPRQHRAARDHAGSSAGEDVGSGAKGVLDGGVLRRLAELGTQRRGEVLGRAGMDAWAWGSDAEVVGVGGVGGLGML